MQNPAYKGKWNAPLIDNPAYKGEWKPRQIPNPEHFVDDAPLYHIGKVGAGWQAIGKLLGGLVLPARTPVLP